MALKFIRKDTPPTYIALSTDVGLDGKISGASIIGGTVFLTDVGSWRIIDQNLKLVPYSEPGTTTTILPSTSPSLSPSRSPSLSPSLSPSASPSISPSTSPSLSPSLSPSASPSISPSVSPSVSPS